MYIFFVVFFFFLLGGAQWGVSRQFVESELSAKWYWTILFATFGCIVWTVLRQVINKRKWNYARSRFFFAALAGAIVACAFSQAFYGILQEFGVCRAYNGFKVTGSFDNPAGFASALTFSVPFGLYLLGSLRKKARLVTGVGLLVILAALILSDSRAGILATAVFAGVAILSRIPNGKVSAAIGAMALLFFLAVPLYQYKKDSADGRILIWKCTLDMIREKPILGYGPGGFKANYMNYQAQYFRENPESRYAMLADDVKRPFNEYLWIITDYGIVGGALLLFIGVGVIRLWRKSRDVISRTALLCLLSIAVFSLFSYPFTYPHTLILFLFSVGVLLRRIYPLSQRALRNAFAVATVGMVVLSFFAVRRMVAEMEWCRIANLSLCGQTERVLPIYSGLEKKLGNTPLFLYNYAAELNVAGRYEESIRVGAQCEKIFADYYTQLLMANNYKSIGKYEEACEHWLLASEMCPNRFVPLYELFEVYTNHMQDTLRAQQLGRIILKKPIKIESMEVHRIVEHVKRHIINTKPTELTKNY